MKKSSYEKAYHRQSETLAEIMRAKNFNEVKQAIVNCDIDVEEIFLSCDEAVPSSEKGQK